MSRINNAEALNLNSSIEHLFPAGICSAPPYLHHLFNSMYGANSRRSQKHEFSQIEFSKRVDKILDQKVRIFMQNPPQSGEALQTFMCDLLAEYKCPTNKNPSDLLNEIYYPYGSKKLYNYSTTFYFCDGLFQSVASQRKLVNFVTVRSMYATYFSPEKSCGISVSEFCQRAQSFFGIKLTCDDNMQNCLIAQVSLKKDLKGSENKFFNHSLSFLEYQKEQLYSLYSELLKVIYTKKSKNEPVKPYKKRLLNAIFLLSFLIGSNPPMFHGTGGAFVSDAMLQILLVSAGFPPMPKNFLSLTEIELLFKFSNPTQESWDMSQRLYLSAQQGKTNELFHPQSAGPKGLLDFLNCPFFKTLFFVLGENNTDKDLMDREHALLSATGYAQRNSHEVYQNCYSALQFNLSLFIDNFDFIKTADPSKTLLTLFEEHFDICFKNNGYLLRMLEESGKLIVAKCIYEAVIDPLLTALCISDARVLCIMDAQKGVQPEKIKINAARNIAKKDLKSESLLSGNRFALLSGNSSMRQIERLTIRKSKRGAKSQHHENFTVSPS